MLFCNDVCGKHERMSYDISRAGLATLVYGPEIDL